MKELENEIKQLKATWATRPPSLIAAFLLPFGYIYRVPSPPSPLANIKQRNHTPLSFHAACLSSSCTTGHTEQDGDDEKPPHAGRTWAARSRSSKQQCKQSNCM